MSTENFYRKRMPSALTRQELAIWREFRFMVEETSLGVSRDFFASTAMTGGQFGVLSNLVEAPLHSMRQQELADTMRWDRTRLSHQLTRMEKLGWIKRKKGDGGVTQVLLAEPGRDAQRRAAPILGRIVKEKFLSRLTQAQLAALREIRDALYLEPDSSSKTGSVI